MTDQQALKFVRDILHELCEVKIIRDVQGKTPEYYDRREKAWEAAFGCFAEYEPEQGGRKESECRHDWIAFNFSSGTDICKKCGETRSCPSKQSSAASI